MRAERWRARTCAHMRAKQVRAGKSTPFFCCHHQPFFLCHYSTYLSLGIFWPTLLVQCWFHAGSLYQLVESGPAGSFRHMRASLLKSGWIVNSGWYGRNSMKLRPNFLTLHFTIGTSGCRSPTQKADGLTCSQLAIDCMVQTSRHSSWPGLAWSFQVRSQDCKACNE